MDVSLNLMVVLCFFLTSVSAGGTNRLEVLFAESAATKSFLCSSSAKAHVDRALRVVSDGGRVW